jgi:lysozyme
MGAAHRTTSLALIFATVLSACAGGPRVVDTAFTPGILLEPVRPSDIATSQPRPMNGDGLEITKVSEGWKPHLYLDPALYCSIGYGHLIWQHACNGQEPENFRRGLSLSEGETLLITDMVRAERAIKSILSNSGDLSDNQYSALCDFVFNVGGENFRTSTLRRVLETRQFDQVAGQLRLWVLARGTKYQGLVDRREREVALFYQGGTIPPRRPSDMAPHLIDITKGEGNGAT